MKLSYLPFSLQSTKKNDMDNVMMMTIMIFIMTITTIITKIIITAK